MIRVTILYPNQQGARFDHDYYATKHIPLARRKLEPHGLIRCEIDKGIASGGTDPAPFIAMGHLIFDSIAQFQEGFGAVGNELTADIPNYTSITPQIQVSEMVA